MREQKKTLRGDQKGRFHTSFSPFESRSQSREDRSEGLLARSSEGSSWGRSRDLERLFEQARLEGFLGEERSTECNLIEVETEAWSLTVDLRAKTRAMGRRGAGQGVKRLWDNLKLKSEASGVKLKIQPTLLQNVDEAIESKSKGGILFHILTAATQQIWKDRNNSVFNGRNSPTPLQVVLQQARLELDGGFDTKSNKSSRQAGIEGLNQLRILQGHIAMHTPTTNSSYATSPDINNELRLQEGRTDVIQRRTERTPEVDTQLASTSVDRNEERDSAAG
ncbi:hypothetical protein R1sor_025071 [Riccia sorocarpa]|uniref:Ribosomal protein S3 n=1 Tax=Riccia sorocarpa TaxID=122646 RepID=A0ABD3G7J5_9MARC